MPANVSHMVIRAMLGLRLRMLRLAHNPANLQIPTITCGRWN
jgi:hypothetical protein